MIKRMAGFCALLAAGIAVLGEFFTPAWNWPRFLENITASVREANRLTNGEAEVCFAGVSHMQFSLNPMRLYENTGLVTYNLASSAQPIEVSYSMAEKAVKKGAKLFVLDASNLFFNWNDESRYRYVLDSEGIFRGDPGLMKSMVDNQLKNDASAKPVDEWIKALFPLVRYHDRWEQLAEVDLSSAGWAYYLQGYILNPYISAAGTTVEDMNGMVETLTQDTKVQYSQRWSDGDWQYNEEETLRYSPWISDENRTWLEKIRTLCEENDCEFLLVKIPAVYLPQSYGSAWTRAKSSYLNTIAEEMGITFFDLLYDADLGIDWAQDTLDGGMHLNYRGSAKVTDFMGEYLLQNYSLTPRVDSRYEDKLIPYRKTAQAAELETSMELTEYMRLVAEYGDRVDVFLAVSDDMRNSLTEADIDALRLLGLTADFENMRYQDSYIAVIDSGTVMYEGTSTHTLTYAGTTSAGVTVNIKSAGWYSGAAAEIILNGTQYAANCRGINLVVYDHESQQVIDSMFFDTWAPEHSGYHVWQDQIFEYERFLFSHGTSGLGSVDEVTP